LLAHNGGPPFSPELAATAPYSALCRRRHNADCADLVIVPTSPANRLTDKVFGVCRSAQSRPVDQGRQAVEARVTGGPGSAHSKSNSPVYTANQLVMRSVATVVLLPAPAAHLRPGPREARAPATDCADLPAADSLPRRRSSPQVGTITRSAQSAIAPLCAVTIRDRAADPRDSSSTGGGPVATRPARRTDRMDRSFMPWTDDVIVVGCAARGAPAGFQTGRVIGDTARPRIVETSVAPRSGPARGSAIARPRRSASASTAAHPTPPVLVGSVELGLDRTDASGTTSHLLVIG
jgi:hypothetical protein